MGLRVGLAPLLLPVSRRGWVASLAPTSTPAFPISFPSLLPLVPTISSLSPLGLPAGSLAARLGHHLLSEQRVGLVVTRFSVHVLYAVRGGVCEPEFIEYRPSFFVRDTHGSMGTPTTRVRRWWYGIRNGGEIGGTGWGKEGGAADTATAAAAAAVCAALCRLGHWRGE